MTNKTSLLSYDNAKQIVSEYFLLCSEKYTFNKICLCQEKFLKFQNWKSLCLLLP